MTSNRVHMWLRSVRFSFFALLALGVLLGGRPGKIDAAAAVFSVNTKDDLVDPQPGNGMCGDGTFCSLRAAIQEANASGNTQIYVPAGLYSLLEGQLVITGTNVFIDGEGADKTVLDGNNTTRVIDIAGSAVVMIRGVMVQNGRAVQSDPAVVPTHYHGGGIHNHGILFLENSALSGNYAPVGGGGGCLGPCGGGLYNAGRATLINVTIAYNNADMGGGGIANSNHLDLYNVTLASNLAPDGGGLYNAGTATLFSTIVANNDGIGPGNNCSSTTNTLRDGGDNLQISFSAPNPQSCGNSIPVADPGIDPVHNANGSAMYFRLYNWSPAIDIVPLSRALAGFDQRGFPRPQDGNGDGIVLGDVGAYERRPIDP